MAHRPRDRKELGFFEHLEELRIRLVRCVLYIAAGAVAGWSYREPLLALLRHPAEVGARSVGIDHLPFRVFEPAGGFVIAIQIALMAGVVLASPLIIWEAWRFIEPALEDHERRAAIVVLPMAIVLFLSGVAFCYVVSPRAFAFLFQIDQSLGVEVERTLRPYLWFIMRLMLGFGLAFELPLVLMFLGFIGLVTSRQLLSWWRHAIVVTFAFAAVVTPTVDPVNMTILAIPMFLLYMLSILFVHIVQRRRREDEGQQEAPGPEDETPPPGEESLRVYEEAWAASGTAAGTRPEEDAPLPPPAPEP